MHQRPAFRTLLRIVWLIAAAGLSRCAVAAGDDRPQGYELRVYTTQSAAQQQRIIDYWRHAAVPAYNRLGCRPIGVFTEIQDSATNRIYVFLPAASPEAFAAIPAQLAADAEYQLAAADFLNAPKTNAAYAGFQSSLLVAFNGMKHPAVPPAGRPPNVFELRTYVSPSEGKGLSKIKMFESGEITVMNKVGLAPIFYGRTLIGPVMPSLVYLTCGENPDAHQRHWQGFNNAPVWKKLQADPQFKGNVSAAIKVLLKRTPASQF